MSESNGTSESVSCHAKIRILYLVNNYNASLLLIGLKKYGIGSWDMIHSQLVPTKSSKRLQMRYKNLTCRRAHENPLKTFNEALMKPLSDVEEEFLYRVYRID